MRLLLISSSRVEGQSYLEHCEEALDALFADHERVLFVPYARPAGISHERYAARIQKRFDRIGRSVVNLAAASDSRAAVENAQAVFVGGGNSFLLLRALYRQDLLQPLRERVREGVPYAGSSAGAVVAGQTIATTNDMPIVRPPRFDALGLMPFDVNPHYLDPDPESTHQGETRAERIREFHVHNDQPVVGMREGALLRLQDGELQVQGAEAVRVFRTDEDPKDVPPGAALCDPVTSASAASLD